MMKFNVNVLSFAALVAFVPTLVNGGMAFPPGRFAPDNGGNGGKIGLCRDQANCIDFTIRKSSTCFGSDCGIEVCMILDTTMEGCSKAGEPISHLCAASDGEGCAAYDDAGYPLTGKGSSTDCTSTTFDGKCEPELHNNLARVEMCQEGKPGQKLYWALKDSDDSDTGPYDFTGDYTFETETETCSPTIRCLGSGFLCAYPSDNSDMTGSTRTWEYTIPSNDGGSCDLCGPPPPSPVPPPTPIFEDVTFENPPAPTPALQISETQVNGDPHFRTWKNEHFEFHGQCDMVMTSVPAFANRAIDLEIHVRTKIVRYWSYIESAAIRIGNDVLEVTGSAEKEDGDAKLHYWSNFEYLGDLTDLAGFPVIISDRRNKYTIDLGDAYPGQKIEINTFKEFVGVKIVGATEESFGEAVGMNGNFKTGKTLARDGVTEIHDYNELGNEWQVLPSDGKLFHQLSSPQFPNKCLLPEDPRGERTRRLGEIKISEEAAEAACAMLKDEFSRKGCVYDILATQDMDMVGAY